jgi:hypothetical protein
MERYGGKKKKRQSHTSQTTMYTLLHIPGLRSLGLRLLDPNDLFARMKEGRIPPAVVASLAERAIAAPRDGIRLGRWKFTSRDVMERLLDADAPGLSSEQNVRLVRRALEEGGFSLLSRARDGVVLRAVEASDEVAETLMAKGDGATLTRLGALYTQLGETRRRRLVEVMVSRSLGDPAPQQAAMWTDENTFLAAIAGNAGQADRLDRALANRANIPPEIARAVLAKTRDAEAVGSAAARLASEFLRGDETGLAKLPAADLRLFVEAVERAIQASETALASRREWASQIRDPREREKMERVLKERDSATMQLLSMFERTIKSVELGGSPEREALADDLLSLAERRHPEAANHFTLGQAVETGLARNRSHEAGRATRLADLLGTPPDQNLAALARNPVLGESHLRRIAERALDRLRLAVAEPEMTGEGTSAALAEILARADAPLDLVETLAQSELVAGHVDVDRALFRNAAAPAERKRAYLERLVGAPKPGYAATEAVRTGLSGRVNMTLVREMLDDPRAMALLPNDAAQILADRWAEARGRKPTARDVYGAPDDKAEEFADLMPKLLDHGASRLPAATLSGLLEADAPGARERDAEVVSRVVSRAREILRVPPTEEAPFPRFEADLLLRRLGAYARQSADADLARQAMDALGSAQARGLRSSMEAAVETERRAPAPAPSMKR